MAFPTRHPSLSYNYSIVLLFVSGRSRTRRRLDVAFRGSVTVHDWAVDASMTLTSIPNPLANDSSVSITQRKDIGLHHGFHHYLFGLRNKRATSSKYDQILVHLRSLLETHAGFSILCTGHSLGGALATLFAFQLALEEDIKKPVICISFASPKTGNISFARAFQELEVQKKIVCLRVANRADLITQIPDRLTCLTFFCQDSIFRHVGIEMLVYRESSDPAAPTHRFRHFRIHHSRFRQLMHDLRHSFWHSTWHIIRIPTGCARLVDFAALHACIEYVHRLYRAQDRVESLSLREVFSAYHTDVGQQSAS